MKKTWDRPIQKALDEGRLLIISPFSEEVRRASRATAAVRNDLMIQLATKVVAGYVHSGGILHRRLQIVMEKRVEVLDVQEEK